MASMGNVLGLIFANMHEENLPELTKARAMASVPFGARYRLVDFPLSSMVNSGITQVGIITQAKYYSRKKDRGSAYPPALRQKRQRRLQRQA